MKGGKYLGKGTYGCVYSPPVKCNHNLQQENHAVIHNNVGKIFFNKEDAEDEYEVTMKYVNTIDPEGLFTNKFLKKCDVKKEHYEQLLGNFGKDKADIVRECRVHEDTTQLIYEHKGDSLSSFIDSTTIVPYEYMKLYYYLLPIIQGLVTMESHRIMHRDIKPDNIIRTENKILFIDFGLAIDYESAFEVTENYVLRHDYIYYPPEFTVREHYFEKDKHSSENYIENITLQCLKKYRKVKFNIIDLERNDIHNEIKSFYKKISKKIEKLYIKNNALTQKDINESVFSKFACKVDIFSFGMVLLEIFNLCITKESLKRYQPNEQFKEDMKSLIRECIKMDPYKRITTDELHKKYTKIVQDYILQ